MDKLIKQAIDDVLKARIDRENYGMLATHRASATSHNTLRKNNITLRENHIEQDGKVIAKIHHHYASRKVNGMYKELKPSIEYLSA